MTTSAAMTPARFSVALNIAQTLKGEGVDVITADLGRIGLRVDVRNKASATKAKEMLQAAGFANVRAMFEKRGLWLVVATIPAK